MRSKLRPRASERSFRLFAGLGAVGFQIVTQGLIDLAEGPRMMSRVVGIAPTEVKIGMKVKAKVDKIGDHDAVVFEPAE